MKRFFALLILISSSQTHASLKGLYVGGNLGGALQRGEHKIANGVDGSQGLKKFSKFGMIYGASLGYLHAMNDGKMYMGVDVYYLLSGISAKKDIELGGAVEGNLTIKPKKIMGLSTIIGTMLNPKTMMFAKVGYEAQSLEFQYKDLKNHTEKAEKYSRNITGLAPGAGFLYRLGKKVSLMVDYTLPVHSKTVIRKSGSVINGVNRGFEYTPSQHRVCAKVLYTF
jgi:hypothetical protein